MAQAPRRPFLDRPVARVLAALVFVGCAAALVYLERERLWQTAANRTAADDPFARCFAERAAQIERMQEEDVIEAAQAELFKTRAEAMCRAEAQGTGNAAPALPPE
jgi:phage gp36-like protein